MHRILSVVLILILSASGCVETSFTSARKRVENMAASGRRLSRPVIFIHGWMDYPIRFDPMLNALRRAASNDQAYIYVHRLSGSGPIHQLAAIVGGRYRHLGPVDVVAHGMGGLVAREAARRYGLQIHTLYSLAVPHLGGRFAPIISKLHDQAREMMPGSDFLKTLNADPASRGFRSISFRLKDDQHVSADSAGYLGGEIYEFQREVLEDAHVNLPEDPRVIEIVINNLLSEN